MIRLSSFRLPRPLFTWPELWYHLLWLPVVYPVAGGVLMGSRYFKRLDVFVVGTLTMLVIHAVSLLLLTMLVKTFMRRYADIQQVRWRYWLVLGGGSLLSAALSVCTIWICSLIPLLEVRFTYAMALGIAGVGGISALLMGYVLVLTDTYGRWQQQQIETEQVRQLTLQQRVDQLKGQINPHFLFNSLNAVSALIAEQPQQAEAAVDQMAHVYRYLLQAYNRTWIPLEQELQFARSYAQLLMLRYGPALIIQIDVPEGVVELGVPPLSFQYLLDDILLHQVAQPTRPLRIQIGLLPDQHLQIRYNHQPRTLRAKLQQAGFGELVASYERLGSRLPRRERHTDDEQIWLPLIPPIPPNTLSSHAERHREL